MRSTERPRGSPIEKPFFMGYIMAHPGNGALFHCIGQDAVCIRFGVGPWIRGPLSIPNSSSEAQSRITLETINGVEPVFPETAIILCS